MLMNSVFQKEGLKEFVTSKTAAFLGFLTILLGYFVVKDALTADAATSNNAIPSVSVGEGGNISITGGGFATDGGSAWSQILTKYRGFIVGISGIAAITMVGVFIFHFIKLAGSATNPSARSSALTGLMWSGVAAAGLGSVSLVVGLFYNSIE
ncbi:hypothetical protein ACOMCU_02125 [Lysinibacillus sp. UGB7]|uniref:hypothetical protein n=1 Tax=Lysinibacillus sp. UGB7 TaxID=3411039 RepID=UPI003B77D8EC